MEPNFVHLILVFKILKYLNNPVAIWKIHLAYTNISIKSITDYWNSHTVIMMMLQTLPTKQRINLH